MATKLTKRGKLDNEITYEFVCDTPADLQAIDEQYIVLGSTAIVLEGDVGFEVYMANSQKEWVNIGGGGGNSGSSEPVWVNQDIIISIPETVLYDENDPESVMQSNVQLNNHVITGNLLAVYENEDYMEGDLAIKINPSMLSSCITYGNVRALNPTQEYYLLCAVGHFSEDQQPEIYALYGDTVISPIPISQVDDPNISEYNASIMVMTGISSLAFYKILGRIITEMITQVPYNTITFALSKIQPEATYDISQLIITSPQAGE